VSLRHFRTVLAGDVGAKALTAAFVLGLVRHLSPLHLASYVYLSAIVILASTLLNGFFNRHYIMAPEGVGTPRSYRAIQVATVSVVYLACSLALARESTAAELIAGLMCTSAAAAFDFRRSHAQKQLQFRAYSAADVLRAFILVVLAIPAVAWEGPSTIAMLLAAQAIAFFAAAAVLPPLPKDATSSWRSTVRWTREVLANSSSLTLLAYFALVGLFGQLPVLLLKRFSVPMELASFGSAFRYYGLLLGVVAAANVVILPHMAQGSGEGAVTTWRSVRNIVGVALGLVLAASLIGYFVIPLIDAGKYPDAPLLFVLLATGLIPGVALAPITAAFLRARMNDVLLRSQLAAITASFVAAYALRHHGAWAAAGCVPLGVLAQFLWLAAATFRHRGALT
jgi:O-antigen/teichoic acid export membrane protein